MKKRAVSFTLLLLMSLLYSFLSALLFSLLKLARKQPLYSSSTLLLAATLWGGLFTNSCLT